MVDTSSARSLTLGRATRNRVLLQKVEYGNQTKNLPKNLIKFDLTYKSFFILFPFHVIEHFGEIHTFESLSQVETCIIHPVAGVELYNHLSEVMDCGFCRKQHLG